LLSRPEELQILAIETLCVNNFYTTCSIFIIFSCNFNRFKASTPTKLNRIPSLISLQIPIEIFMRPNGFQIDQTNTLI